MFHAMEKKIKLQTLLIFLYLVSQNYQLKLFESNISDCLVHHLNEAFGFLCFGMVINQQKVCVQAITWMPSSHDVN